ncbi:hypothetical protein [Leucobacter sp. USHLN154]|uniref:hypothetical protein n=1 Tax=Leucobacter sp. USHLN154 TaxID=3081269 RepID=UPI00301740CF
MSETQSIVGTRVETHADDGFERTRLTVHVGDAIAPARSALLTATVYSVVEFLAAVEHAPPQGSAVIDIRLPPFTGARQAAEAEAFVHAAKGLVQSWTLERGSASSPANVVVSESGQDAAREAAVEYFTSELGAFSRGSLFDLREERK